MEKEKLCYQCKFHQYGGLVPFTPIEYPDTCSVNHQVVNRSGSRPACRYFEQKEK